VSRNSLLLVFLLALRKNFMLDEATILFLIHNFLMPFFLVRAMQEIAKVWVFVTVHSNSG
jgi:hypothetical protein